MNADRPLTGITVGISISESEEMERLGFNRSDMNRCVVRLSEALLAAGARLAFGHDWRPGGVMEAVAALAVRYFAFARRGDPAGEREAPILNRVAWPDVPFLAQSNTESAQAETKSMAELLEGIVDAKQTIVSQGKERNEALSLMREELANLCQIRVCLGGKLRGFSGDLPGVIEEARATLRRDRDRPLFVSGIFGGASRLVVGAISNEPVEIEIEPQVNLESVKREIRGLFAESQRPLKPSEERRLWHATSTEQCVELILRGAVKWSERRVNQSG